MGKKRRSKTGGTTVARAAAAGPAAGGTSSQVMVPVSGDDPPTRNKELGTALLDFLNPLAIEQIEWSQTDVAWRLTLGTS